MGDKEQEKDLMSSVMDRVKVRPPPTMPDLKLANPRCKHCYGTGSIGKLVKPGNKRVILVCRCVVRANQDKAHAGLAKMLGKEKEAK